MQDAITQGLVIFLFFGIPAIVGARLAWNKGRNFLLWGVICGVLAPFILVLWFEKPLREIPGKFRRCPNCREWLKWRDQTCKYCSAEIPQH